VRDAIKPSLHLFVCTNATRGEGSPLGPGCSEHGEAVYDALKREVASRGKTRETWITRTFCLGICPKNGATVGRYPPREGHSPIETEIVPEDVASLLEASSFCGAPPHAPPAPRALEESSAGDRALLRGREAEASVSLPLAAALARVMDELEALQRKKVLDLARRLKPGLTLEDVQNPHDFPELDDPDWHYADGVLAGIASVKSAFAALASERAHPSSTLESAGAELGQESRSRRHGVVGAEPQDLEAETGSER
jgi:hypothetical protein